jgi:hypothetical protein
MSPSRLRDTDPSGGKTLTQNYLQHVLLAAEGPDAGYGGEGSFQVMLVCCRLLCAPSGPRHLLGPARLVQGRRPCQQQSTGWYAPT